MNPHAYVPPERTCIDQPGTGLVAALCGAGDVPMLQLVTGNGQTGQSVHVRPEHLPPLVWAMLQRSGADPHVLLEQVTQLAREPLRAAGQASG